MKLIQFIQNLGVSNRLTEDENRIVRTLNLNSALTIAALLLSLVIALAFNCNPYYIFLILFATFLYTSLILLHALGYAKRAQFYFSFITPLWASISLVFVGHQFGQAYVPIVTGMNAFFIFRKNLAYRWVHIIYNVGIYCLILFYLSINGPLFPDFPDYPFDDIAVFLVCLAWVYLVLRSYEGDLNSLINSLGNKNAELKQKKDQLIMKSEELEQFAYITSHDLKSPISNIINFTKLLNDTKLNQLDDEGKRFVQFIGDSSARMQNLVEDMLQHSVIGTGDKKDWVKLNDILIELCSEFAPIVEQKNGKIIYDELPNLFAHKTEMRSLFQNLIGNAIKYCKENIPPIIQISVKSNPKYFEFRIKDNGIGFDMDFAPKIFNAFQRLGQKPTASGTGIGLANCKKIIELHGGKIWAESEPGIGSVFHFIIPKNAK